MKKFLIFLLIPLFSFSQERLTEEMIIDHINEFFSVLNIKNYNKDLLSQTVTSDFIIYEMGDKFTLNEFTDFIESAGYLGWGSTEWFLSDFTISIDSNSAHASYLKNGRYATLEMKPRRTAAGFIAGDVGSDIVISVVHPDAVANQNPYDDLDYDNLPEVP